jgi:DNA (cytosine-5)-methyltransferase 1
MKLKALSLFANVGIGETYLKDLGIDVVVANELLENRAKIYQHFHQDSTVIPGDITDKKVFDKIIKTAREKEINVIIATPPCQGMSIAGQMNEDDPRNTLIVKAMEALKRLKPDYMLIENVPQMLKTAILFEGKKINIQEFISQQVSKDYYVKFDVFDASDFGTPQYRKRTIVRIYKKGLSWDDPEKQKAITVRDVIGDLPSLKAGEKSSVHPYHYAKKHNDNHILWMSHAPTGKTAFENPDPFKPTKDGRVIKGFSTTYKRIEWDKPSPTVTMANGSISSQNNVHPGRQNADGTYSDARVLTPLEVFRVMGLPDDWNPPANLTENTLRHVIGEAVPPKMMRAMFEPLMKNSKK